MVGSILSYICMLIFREADKNTLTSRIFQSWSAHFCHPLSASLHNPTITILLVRRKVNTFWRTKKIAFILLTCLHPKRFQILLKDWNAYKGNSVDFIHGTSFLRKFHKTVLTHRIPFRPLVISYKLFLLYFSLHSPPLS